MTTWDQRGFVEDVLARATDDWLHVADFVSVSRRTGVTDPSALRAMTLGLITEVLVDGFMVAGDVDEFGFHEWLGSSGDAIVMITQLWEKDDLSPTPGSVAWFNLTPNGEVIGQHVISRES